MLLLLKRFVSSYLLSYYFNMWLLAQIILLCFCSVLSESRVLQNNAGHTEIPPLQRRHYSIYPGMVPSDYPNYFYERNKGSSIVTYDDYYKTTTEATTTTVHFTESIVSATVTDPTLQSYDEVTIKDDDNYFNTKIDVIYKQMAKHVQEKAKREDEEHKSNEESEVDMFASKSKTNESVETSTKGAELSKNTDYILIPTNTNPAQQNTGQMNTVALSPGMIVPAISIRSLNQELLPSNFLGSNNPAGDIQSYAAPSQVIQKNQPTNINTVSRNSVLQAAPLYIPQNTLINNVQPSSYNIMTEPNNAVTNNIPTSYYLESYGQALLLNNGLQIQNPPQIYTLLPNNNIENSVITNPPNNFGNQLNQNYVPLNQPSNLITYKTNPEDNVLVNQPNNYVPLINLQHYVTFSNQPTKLIPLNTQGNQYVTLTTQPINIDFVSQPNNMVSEDNQPNNLVTINGQSTIQPTTNLLTDSNQPNNLDALNSDGNIVQAEPQTNVVQLFSMKEKDSGEENSDEKEETDNKANEKNDEIDPSEKLVEIVDA